MMNDEQYQHDDVLAEGGSAAWVARAESPNLTGSGADPEGPDEQAAGDDEGGHAKTRSRWSFLTEMVVLFAVALTIALLIKTFVVQPFFIPSASMEDTLLIGDKVLVNKLVYHLRPIGRGDVVVFNGAGSWDSPTAVTPPNRNPAARVYDATVGALIHSIEGLFGTAPGQTDYIKRVIGIPGDHIVCCNSHGQITVNGVALNEQSYLIPGAQPSQDPFNVVVPPGRLWVMGDNRPESADSRLHDCKYPDPQVTCVPYDRNGTIPQDQVVGRAFMIVWPPSRVRILPIPATFSQRGLSHGAASAQGARTSAEPNSASALAAGGVTALPSAPYLPLAGGFAAAVPLTVLERRLRLRRRRGRAGLERRGARRG
ncbi:MAG TPA: signal peptidase I [Streptosporangiaceae bacterium]|nr:signal peptidase I [Streptosporangiaceae bacterium]